MFLTEKEKIEKRISELKYYEEKCEQERDILNLLDDKIDHITNGDWNMAFRDYPNLYPVWYIIVRRLNNSIETLRKYRFEIEQLEAKLRVLTSETEP